MTADGRRPATLAGRAWARARRPAETVEAARWLFFLLALACLLFILPAPLLRAEDSMRLVAAAAAGVLAASWVAGLRWGQFTPSWFRSVSHPR